MKILQINKFHHLRGGSERYVFELSKLLTDNGQEVMQFSMTDDKNYYSKYGQYFIKPVNLDKFNLINIIKFFYNREAAKKLEKLIKAERPNIAHLHNIAHQISPAIIKVLKKYNIPIVQTLHDYKLICPNAKLFSRGQVCYKCRGGRHYNCFLRKCSHNSWAKSFLLTLEAYLNNKILKYYDLVDLFIAPSEFMKNVCVDFGLPENKIKLIYNFIEDRQEDTVIPARFAENSARRAEAGIRKKYLADEKLFLDSSLRGNDKSLQPAYLLYFGRLSEEKGIEIILAAMKKISGIKLNIVGAGPDYKKYQLFIDKHKLNGRAEFLGPKYGDELERLIKQAKAVIMPSLWPENLPYSVLESLALNKIVIASNIGGLPEIIQDGYNGFLFKSGSSADLAGKINSVLADNQLTGTIETNAKFSIKKFNSQKHYREISAIYQNLL